VHVFILDPHPIFRRGLAASIAMMDGISGVVQAESVPDAFSDVALFASDMVILDPVVPGGVDAIAAILNAGSSKVLVCTSDCSEATVLGALRAGATGYLRKESLTHDGLASALVAVAGGQSVIVPEVLTNMVGVGVEIALAEDTEPAPHVAGGGRAAALVRLSERERAVLALIAEGLPTREVAERLNYSERTIKNVLHDVVKKLNARSRSQAVAQAVRDGLI